MKTYETIAILRPNVSDEYLGTLTKKVEKSITTKPGQLVKKEDWGVKRLAYEIKKEKQGRYLYWTYQQLEKAPGAIDKNLRFEENVLRYVTVVSDHELKASKEKKVLAKKKASSKSAGKDSRKDKINIDFKDATTLAKYITEKGKIVPQRVSGVTAGTQRAIAKAIKRARQIAILSYTEGFSFGGGQQHGYGQQSHHADVE